MTKGQRRDGSSAWLLTSCFLLPLVTMSVVWLNRPQPQPATTPVTFASIQTPTLPPVKDDDGDGDELLEHWNNPLFSAEQRRQLAGMAVFFAGTGLAAFRRRTLLRRFYRAR